MHGGRNMDKLISRDAPSEVLDSFGRVSLPSL